MERFKLRVPAKQEIINALRCMGDESLRQVDPISFTFPDAATFSSDNQMDMRFLPVLETDEDISCLKDGTVICLGRFCMNDQLLPLSKYGELAIREFPENFDSDNTHLSMLPAGPTDEQQVTWIKCRNTLIAMHPLIGQISCNALKTLGLLEGVSVELPFYEAVSKYFFDQAMAQPYSNQRQIGQIMYDLLRRQQFFMDPVSLSKDELYTLASHVHTCWINTYDLTLDQVIHETISLLQGGIDDFGVIEADGSCVSYEFPAGVVGKVLTECRDQEVFDHLIMASAELCVPHALLDDNGKPTVVSRALDALNAAEEALSKAPKSFDVMIKDAKTRATVQQPTTRSSLDLGPCID